MRALPPLLLLLALAAPVAAQPAPPRITVYGCGARTCALVSGADTVTSDPAPASAELLADGARLLIWPAPPASVSAAGPGGEARWEARASAPTPGPLPTPTPEPELPYRVWLGAIWR